MPGPAPWTMAHRNLRQGIEAQGQQLFLRQDDAPLGAAASIVMMLIIAGFVSLFLWAVGYSKMRERSR